jgi:hypothetical protein
MFVRHVIRVWWALPDDRRPCRLLFGYSLSMEALEDVGAQQPCYLDDSPTPSPTSSQEHSFTDTAGLSSEDIILNFISSLY